MRVIKSRLTGFCRGVSETIKKASECLSRADELNLPCYSIGKLIHNNCVVKEFEEKGLKTVNSPDCPPGIALIRAHGISDSLRKSFEEQGFTLVDSTCSNILRTREKMKETGQKGRTLVLIGNPEHAEVRGLSLSFDVKQVYDLPSTEKLIETLAPDTAVTVFTQTTFDYEMHSKILRRLGAYFKFMEEGNTLCSVCNERKKSVSQMLEKCDVAVVVGSEQSNNTTDLLRFIENSGKPAVMVENEESFDSQTESFLKKFNTAGVCSGTSTSQTVIDKVVKHLEAL